VRDLSDLTCNIETELVIGYIMARPFLAEAVSSAGEVDEVREAALHILWGFNDEGVSWEIVRDFFFVGPEGDNVTELPLRSRTIEEVAQDVIERGLSTEQALREVVAAHQETIDLILDTLDEQTHRLDRLKKQVSALVEVHGT
jgi:hypothetical protein